jgi:hypothetical protein
MSESAQSRSKKNKRALSSSGAIRSTLKAEKETQSSGAPESSVDSFKGVIGSMGGVPAAKGKASVIACEDAMIEGEAIRLESKPWNRLDRGLRIRKIRDWVETLTEYPEDLRTEIRICLERSIKAGKLQTNSSVEYDTGKRQVVRVPALSFVNDDYKELSLDDDGEEIMEDIADASCSGSAPRVFIRETDKTKRRKKT